MKITIINSERNEKRYTREELEAFVAQLSDGTYRQQYIRDFNKEVCFAAEWVKLNGERLRVGKLRSGMLKAKSYNCLILLSLENLRDLSTVEEYKRLAILQHYTLRLNVMTGTPEYRMNAVGYGFLPLDQAARNTMAIKALKAGVESWDKDLNRYIDSNLIPKYYPMEDYLRHLPKWNGKHDYVGELARRVKTAANFEVPHLKTRHHETS